MFESIPLAARQSMVSGWKLGLQDGDNEDKRAPKNPPAMLGSTAGTFLCLSGGVWVGGVCARGSGKASWGSKRGKHKASRATGKPPRL